MTIQPEKAITRIQFEDFTAFRSLEVALGPGINVFIGENGAGKTHLLKATYTVLYAMWVEYVLKKGKLNGLGMVDVPDAFGVGFNGTKYLIRQNSGSNNASIKTTINDETIEMSISENGFSIELLSHSFANFECPRYVPVKDILAHAPGFRSLMTIHRMPFESIYGEIVDLAFLPPLKELPSEWREIVDFLSKSFDGQPGYDGETFFLQTPQGKFDFMLVAEGWRKIALLMLLIRNGALHPNTYLFWDEPDSNLNPKLVGVIVKALLAVQRLGVQIFVATHSYALLREFDLSRQSEDHIRYHALYRSSNDGDISVHSTDEYPTISPNAISDAYSDLYDRDIRRALSRS